MAYLKNQRLSRNYSEFFVSLNAKDRPVVLNFSEKKIEKALHILMPERIKYLYYQSYNPNNGPQAIRSNNVYVGKVISEDILTRRYAHLTPFIQNQKQAADPKAHHLWTDNICLCSNGSPVLLKSNEIVLNEEYKCIWPEDKKGQALTQITDIGYGAERFHINHNFNHHSIPERSYRFIVEDEQKGSLYRDFIYTSLYEFPWTSRSLSDIQYIEISEGIYNTRDMIFRESDYKKNAYIATSVKHIDDYKETDMDTYRDLLVTWSNFQSENNHDIIPYVIETLYQDEPMFLNKDNIVLNTALRTIFPRQAVRKEQQFLARYYTALTQENAQSILEEEKNLTRRWKDKLPRIGYPLS